MWKQAKSWIVAIAIILILHYSGAIAGLSGLTNKAMIKSGLMDAAPTAMDEKEPFNYSLTVKTLDGTPVSMETLKGKTIFLNMWATWCGPCRAEMPAIQSLYDKVNKDSIAFVMLSIDAEDHPEKVANYAKSKKFSFPVYIAGALTSQTNVKSIPTTFVISPDGYVVYKNAGMADYDTNKFRKFLARVSLGTQQKN